MSLADALAILRALAVAPIWYALVFDSRAAALGIFVVAALSDALDGWLARRTGSLSRHGALLDPLADKVFVLGTALELLLVSRGTAISPLLFTLLAVREITAAAMRVAAYRANTHRGADAGGKLKTAAEMCALAILILVRPPEPVGVAAVGLLWVAVTFGLVSLARDWLRGRKRLS